MLNLKQIVHVCIAALVGYAHVASAALYTDASQLPTLKYDFVIIGAGTAGNVVATRLTENPKFSVLVIEAGISDKGVLDVEVPFFAPLMLPNASVSWNYSTTPQAALNDRVLIYPRGRVLGGSSSINFMTSTRGSDDEYDRWAELTEDRSWSWKHLSRYFFKSSRLVPTVGNRSTEGLVDPEAHGFGPVQISLSDVPTELDDRILNTSKSSGEEFPFNIDLQSGNAVGVGSIQNTVGNGMRSSSATAYLEPALNRSNLHVLIENTVTRLIQSRSNHHMPVFKKVEVAASPSSKRTIVTAKKEVILSAGAVGTPHILMLSGIGDATDLRTFGIKPRVNIPDVGRHLQDHPIIDNYFVVNSNNTTDDLLRNSSLFNATLAEWMENRTGIFGNAPASNLAFLRMPHNASIFANVPDPAAGPRSGHIEIIWRDEFAADLLTQPATGHFMTVNAAVVTPTSRGSVRLASTDPFESPLINPNFFDTTFDRFAMLSAVKLVRKFLTASPWQGFVAGRVGALGDAETDEEINTALLDAVVSMWHPTGTARMAPRHVSWGVVDPQLRVKGVRGLRIVDASVFPIIPAAHTGGPVYIVAERAADIIKADWGF